MKQFIHSLLSEAFAKPKREQLVSRGSPPSCYRGPEGRRPRRSRVEPGAGAGSLGRSLAAADRGAPRRALAEERRRRERDDRGTRLPQLQARARVLVEAARRGAGRGRSIGRRAVDRPRKVQVEFVSANPTGPLTVGHGRNAVLGDSIARLLEARRTRRYARIHFNKPGSPDAGARRIGRAFVTLEAPRQALHVPRRRLPRVITSARRGPSFTRSRARRSADAEPHKPVQGRRRARDLRSTYDKTLERISAPLSIVPTSTSDSLYADGSNRALVSDALEVGPTCCTRRRARCGSARSAPSVSSRG